MSNKILQIKDLEVKYLYNQKVIDAIRGLTLDVFSNEIIAIVGESNSGKSVLMSTLANLLNQNGWISGGEIIYNPPENEVSTKINERSDIVEYHRSFMYGDTIRDVRRFYANQIEILSKEIKTIELMDVEETIQKEEILSKKLDQLRIKNETKKSNSLSFKISSLQFEINQWRRYVFLQHNVDEKEKYLNELIEKIEVLKDQSEKIRAINLLDRFKLFRIIKVIRNVRDNDHVWTDDEIFYFKKYFMKHEKLNDIEEILLELGKKQQEGINLTSEEYSRIESKWNSIRRLNFMNRMIAQQEISKLRGSTMGTVFENPENQLNPLETVGSQIAVVLKKNKIVENNEIDAEVIRLLERVGISNASKRYKQRSSRFSLAEQQRICIAIAIAARPRILLCDEPVHNLDVVSRINIVNLLASIQKEMGITIIITTHDIRNVINYADRVGIIYAGQIVEIGTAKEVITNPQHPYTWSILMSLPEINKTNNQDYILSGDVPDLSVSIIGDAFAPRNKFALKIDWIFEPPTFKLTDTHFAKTWLLDYRSPKVERPAELKNIWDIFEIKKDN